MVKKGVRLERKNRTAIVFIDRPEKNNAFDAAMFDALEQVTGKLQQDLPRAVVLTGAGEKAFCAGFDVNPKNPMTMAFLDAVNKKDAPAAKKIIDRMRQVVDGFIGLPVPLIAAVNGLAYGGGAELATRCDLRVMDPVAELCFSEVRLGLMPDWGGGPCLAHLIGPSKSKDLILTARVVKTDEAVRIGWADRVSQKGKTLEEALELAGQIAKNGPGAVRHALSVIRQSHGLTLWEALNKEAESAAALIASGECVHGITAFLEKKPPRFP